MHWQKIRSSWWFVLFSPSEDKILAENIPVPSSPVPIATIEVQSQGSISSPSLSHQAAVTPVKKTRFQEEHEDVNKPAWVLSGAPWVTIAFAIVQIREMMSVMKDRQNPAESESLQVRPVFYGRGLWCKIHIIIVGRVKVQLIHSDAGNIG